MKKRRVTANNGLPQGVGTTSAGVYYDTRIDDKPSSTRRLRQSVARGRKVSGKRLNAMKAHIRNGVLVAGAVVMFAAISALFGDTLWDAVSMPETEPVAEMAAVEAIETQAEEAVAADSVLVSVWIPQSGSKYHKTDTCSGMQGAVEVAIDKAKLEGLTACKRCSPPE